MNFLEQLVGAVLPLGVTLSQFNNPLLLFILVRLQFQNPGIKALNLVLRFGELIGGFVTFLFGLGLLIALKFLNFDA